MTTSTQYHDGILFQLLSPTVFEDYEFEAHAIDETGRKIGPMCRADSRLGALDIALEL